MTLEHFVCNMEAILSFTWHFVIYFSSVLDHFIYYTLYALSYVYSSQDDDINEEWKNSAA